MGYRFSFVRTVYLLQINPCSETLSFLVSSDVLKLRFLKDVASLGRSLRGLTSSHFVSRRLRITMQYAWSSCSSNYSFESFCFRTRVSAAVCSTKTDESRRVVNNHLLPLPPFIFRARLWVWNIVKYWLPRWVIQSLLCHTWFVLSLRDCVKLSSYQQRVADSFLCRLLTSFEIFLVFF